MTTLKPRTTSVVIYQGDDLERLAELRREADAAQRRADVESLQPRRIGDDDSPPDEAARAAKDAYDAFVDEAAERAVEVEVHALPRKKFRSLLADHKPRGGNEDDKQYDVNMDSFPDALLNLSMSRPTFDTSDERQDFLDNLSDGDYEKLFAVTYWLNRSPGADPSESRYSLARQSSDAI